jgi:hypothetical protein
MCKIYKKTLVYMYNASFSSGIFTDRLKIAKVIPRYKKGDIHDLKIIDLYPFYWYFPKY